MRERTTWDRDQIVKASTRVAEDPRAMNQDHLQQQPSADEYVIGGPSEFAEDVSSSSLWKSDYDGEGKTRRNELGMPEMRADTFNHAEKTAADDEDDDSDDEEELLKKAELCTKIARKMLPRGASESLIEDQSVALMYLPSDELVATSNRLAGVVLAQDDEDEGDSDDEGQSKEAQDQSDDDKDEDDKGQSKEGQQQMMSQQQLQSMLQQAIQALQQQTQQAQGLDPMAQDQEQQAQQQQTQQAQQEQMQAQQEQQAQQQEQTAQQQLQAIEATVQQMVQQALAQQTQQAQQGQPQQTQQAQGLDPMAQQDMMSDDQLLDDMLQDQMMDEQLMDDGMQMYAGSDDIQLEGSALDTGVTLGADDQALMNLFASNSEVQMATQAQELTTGIPVTASVRTASTRTVGTRPSQGVSQLGGGSAGPSGGDVDKLAGLWKTSPDIKGVF